MLYQEPEQELHHPLALLLVEPLVQPSRYQLCRHLVQYLAEYIVFEMWYIHNVEEHGENDAHE